MQGRYESLVGRVRGNDMNAWIWVRLCEFNAHARRDLELGANRFQGVANLMDSRLSSAEAPAQFLSYEPNA